MALEIKTPRYVINIDTNEVYAYKEGILDRPRFMPFYDDPPPIDRATGLCIFKEKPDPLLSSLNDKKAAAAEHKANERVEALFIAMQSLKKIAFATNNDKPKINLLEKKVFFRPTIQERDEAFVRYKEWKEASANV